MKNAAKNATAVEKRVTEKREGSEKEERERKEGDKEASFPRRQSGSQHHSPQPHHLQSQSALAHTLMYTLKYSPYHRVLIDFMLTCVCVCALTL